MSDLRPVGIPIDIGGEERHFLFTLNAIDEIQCRFDEPLEKVIDKLTNKKMAAKALRGVVTVLINDDIRRKKHDKLTNEEEFTEEEVGWLLHEGNILDVTMIVLLAYGKSLPEPDEFAPPKQETGR